VRPDLLALPGSKDDSVTRIGSTYPSCFADFGFAKSGVITQPVAIRTQWQVSEFMRHYIPNTRAKPTCQSRSSFSTES